VTTRPLAHTTHVKRFPYRPKMVCVKHCCPISRARSRDRYRGGWGRRGREGRADCCTLLVLPLRGEVAIVNMPAGRGGCSSQHACRIFFDFLKQTLIARSFLKYSITSTAGDRIRLRAPQKIRVWRAQRISKSSGTMSQASKGNTTLALSTEHPASR